MWLCFGEKWALKSKIIYMPCGHRAVEVKTVQMKNCVCEVVNVSVFGSLLMDLPGRVTFKTIGGETKKR